QLDDHKANQNQSGEAVQSGPRDNTCAHQYHGVNTEQNRNAHGFDAEQVRGRGVSSSPAYNFQADARQHDDMSRDVLRERDLWRLPRRPPRSQPESYGRYREREETRIPCHDVGFWIRE